MAQEATDESKLSYEDLIDVESELKKRQEFLEIALSPRDKDKWTDYDTNDKNLEVCYAQVGDSGVYTVLGITSMDTNGNGNINDYFKYQENGYNDVYEDPKNRTDNTIENKIIKLIDPEHQLVYNSSKSGFMLVSNRDFSYMRTRFTYSDYTFTSADGTYSKTYPKIVAQFSYSPEQSVNELMGIKEKCTGFVRGNIERSGFVLYCEDENNLNKFTIIKVLTLDPGGSIPQWVVNSAAPSKGMEVTKFVDGWERMMEALSKREQNGYKKDHVPLFEKCDERLLTSLEGQDKKVEQDDTQPTEATETTADDQKQE